MNTNIGSEQNNPNMKHQLNELVIKALTNAVSSGQLEAAGIPSQVAFEVPKTESHGDFSTNVAMTMAAVQKMKPHDIAKIIMEHIDDNSQILDNVKVAGPGFINFFISRKKWYEVLQSIHRQSADYGRSELGKGQRVQVEFVSANPTGPLHVGHGRCAAVGDTLARVLAAAGYEVQKEYYTNDTGRQISTLGRSVFFRYRQIFGQEVEFPSDAYQGDYIKDIAKQVIDREGDRLLNLAENDAISICAQFASGDILAGIRTDLEAFGVSFDCWFSEQSLYDSGAVQKAIDNLRSRDIAYEQDGALWVRTSNFGDEKDRVIVRQNGATTYFASDIAYHKDKMERGFDRVIDIWGADHHGYVDRISASIQAMGFDKHRCQVLLVHLVNLLRDGKPAAMSTRSGEFVTLKEVIDEVGRDAARFLYLSRHYESPLDFDLEVAKQQSNDNPVYYVQYVHARISNILRKAGERGYKGAEWNEIFALKLGLPEEVSLIKLMSRYPEVVATSALLAEPHRIPFYLKELAGAFHGYYHDRNKHQVVGDDRELSMARICLVAAIRTIIKNGLDLLGVSAPESM